MVQPAAALGSYGMLCRASLTSPALGAALKRWCRHHRLLTDDLVHRLTETGGSPNWSSKRRAIWAQCANFA